MASEGRERRQYTTADGLSSDQIVHSTKIRGHAVDRHFGGGLNALRNGKIPSLGARDGLLSDNIGKVFDDGESLWLSTTRGICRIAKQPVVGFQRAEADQPGARELRRGRRFAQRAVRARLSDRRRRHSQHRRTLWFTTGRGLAVLDPDARKRLLLSPVAHLVQMTANGDPVDLGRRGTAGAGHRTPADPLYRDPSERAGAGAIFLPAGGFGSRIGCPPADAA